MLSKSEKRNAFLKCFFITTIYLALVFFALKLFASERYLIPLLVWCALESILLFSIKNFAERKKAKKILSFFFYFLTAAGTVFFLLQLNIADRDLAEVWIKAARAGTPFGFFSFFAVEIYAYLLLFAVILFSNEKYFQALFYTLALHTLCIFIFTENIISIILTAFFTLLSLLYRKKLQSFILPISASFIISLVFIFFHGDSISIAKTITPFDMHKIVERVNPDFPLLTTIQGLNGNGKSKDLKGSPSMSEKKIFTIQTSPMHSLYLATNRYSHWSGEEWIPYEDLNYKSPVKFFYGEDAEIIPKNLHRINLTLDEDYYPVLPCTLETTDIQFLDRNETLGASISRSQSITLKDGLFKGNRIVLFEDLDSSNQENGYWIKSVSISKNIQLLAEQLKEKCSRENFQSDFINNTLYYLSDGFIYTLDPPSIPKHRDPFDFFLFESKEGFCSWYAGAFTLIMQAADIPCRMVEGYKVTTDEKGFGRLCGLHFHSWAEVFIEGKWQTVDATPTSRNENPFAYVKHDDKKTKSYFEALGQKPETEELSFQYIEKQKNHIFQIGLAAAFILAVVFLIIIAITLKTPAVKRNARRFVKKYARKGIPSPAESGWLLWKNAVSKTCRGSPKEINRTNKALDAADKMIEYLYNHQHSTQSVEVWCSHKVLQSDSIPFISTQSIGVLNPPHE